MLQTLERQRKYIGAILSDEHAPKHPYFFCENIYQLRGTILEKKIYHRGLTETYITKHL